MLQELQKKTNDRDDHNSSALQTTHFSKLLNDAFVLKNVDFSPSNSDNQC